MLFGEPDLAVGGGLLQQQPPLVLGEQAVALPDLAHSAGRDLDALEAQFLLDAHRAVARMDECMIEHGLLLDLGRARLGCSPLAPGRRSISLT